MPSNDSPQNASQDRPTPDYALAFFVLCVAGIAFWFGRGIQGTAVGSEYDPGPRFFPWLLASVLAVWGAGSLIRSLILSLSFRAVAAKESAETTSREATWPAVVLIMAMLLYIPAISVLGFTLSTLAFATAAIYWLTVRVVAPSKTASESWRWRASRALIVSLTLVVVVRVLFIWCFKVQLPSGMLGLPF